MTVDEVLHLEFDGRGVAPSEGVPLSRINDVVGLLELAEAVIIETLHADLLVFFQYPGEIDLGEPVDLLARYLCALASCIVAKGALELRFNTEPDLMDEPFRLSKIRRPE